MMEHERAPTHTLAPAQDSTNLQAAPDEARAQDLEMDWLRDVAFEHERRPDPEQPLTTAADAYTGPVFGKVTPGRDGWNIKESTVQTYRKRSARLWRAASERKARLRGDLEAPALIKPIDVVDYLNWRRLPQPGLPPISPATWASYRSALLWDFSRTQEPEFILACNELERLQDKTEHTPTTKKGIKAADLKRLIDQLGCMNRSRGWGRRTQYWLQAGVATGLRPGEWEFARWADVSQDLLIAPTSKVKASAPAYARPKWKDLGGPQDLASASADQASRPPSWQPSPPAHLPLRAIPVDPSDRLYVAEHLQAIRQAAEAGCTFARYQEYCRQTLWRACRQLWGGSKRYALYQARHQFSANSKGKLSPDELATAMGHSRRSTAAQHYAPARQAHKKTGGLAPKQGLAHAHPEHFKDPASQSEGPLAAFGNAPGVQDTQGDTNGSE